MARDPVLAIKEAEMLGLEEHYAYHILLGKLYSPLQPTKAKLHYEKAKSKARSKTEGQWPSTYLDLLQQSDPGK